MISSLLSTANLHETRICEALDECRHNGGQVFDRPLLLLGFTNRCGSNLLADYLRTVKGLAGFHEQLNYDTVIRACADMGVTSFPDYFRHFAARPRHYGFKASIHQVAMLYRLGIAGMYPAVRVLHILRTDTLAQAVSHSIADQTKQWTSLQARVGDPVFDARDIRKRLTGIDAQNEAFGSAARVFGFAYERVIYEDLVADPLGVVGRAAAFFGAPPPAELPAPRIARQADAVNDDFMRRYRAITPAR